MSPQTFFFNFFSHLNYLETRKNEAFGSSLLLANSPMSPKVVNGSFAAIIDADEFLAKAYAGIRITVSVINEAKKWSIHQRNIPTFRIRTRRRCVEESVEF